MRLYALVALCSVAQTQPAFEVVSVKPSIHGPAVMRSDPGRLIIESQPIDALIRVAYGLREYQYQGPPWLHTARYDIVATTASPRTRSAQLMMLRGLLADRFALKLHHESKTMPVYNMVLAKNGPKLTAMGASQPEPFELYSNFSMAPVGDRTELRGYGSLAARGNSEIAAANHVTSEMF